MYGTKFRTGDTSAHTALKLASTMIAAFGDTWKSRGWELTFKDNAWTVTGSEGQFYLDAVADDANGAAVIAFLARFNPELYAEYEASAADDFIDLGESTDTFLLNKTLEEDLPRRLSRG